MAHLFHHEFTRANRELPPETAPRSPLLALHRSSDVNELTADQVAAARRVLRRRQEMLDHDPGALADPDGPAAVELAELQRAVAERFLAGRRAYFGAAQCEPLPGAPALAAEGRDVFVVVKYMDEAPHIEATLRSLLNQRGVDPRRVVIVAVDNNSTDGSDRIVETVAAAYRGDARIVPIRQRTPGAGNAARLGVDRSIATVLAMCGHDGRWDRLQHAVIGVSDGDTVYAPDVLAENLRLFDENPGVDGVMPFLTYKLVAALRLFAGHRPAPLADLRAAARAGDAVDVDLDLSAAGTLERLPRAGRRPAGGAMELRIDDGRSVTVPLDLTDTAGERFGVLRDPAGRLAYVLADRRIVLDEAPMSGFDEALLMLDDDAVPRGAKWRWHTLVGHDLFLSWAFEGMGLPEEMVFPDTSDALKMFRAWSFAVGGQHQLRRADLRIATGSDYQSGRVLQEVGAVTRLGPARAPAETEIDRLLKMVRNLAGRQGVFYGETRSGGLERATGLYVHMTRIQADLEAEVRAYPDVVFEDVVFPERVLFPLRWMLQNAIRFHAHADPAAARLVSERVLPAIFADEAPAVERDWFGPDTVAAVRGAAFHAKQDTAERVAESVIAAHYPAIMRFYVRTLRDFLTRHGVAPERFAWLLDGLPESRNAITEPQPRVHPAVVWDGPEFEIDVARGQVVRMHAREDEAS